MSGALVITVIDGACPPVESMLSSAAVFSSVRRGAPAVSGSWPLPPSNPFAVTCAVPDEFGTSPLVASAIFTSSPLTTLQESAVCAVPACSLARSRLTSTLGLGGDTGPSGVAGDSSAFAAISSSRCFFLRNAKSLRDILTLGSGGGDGSRIGCAGTVSTTIGSACDVSLTSDAVGGESFSCAEQSSTGEMSSG